MIPASRVFDREGRAAMAANAFVEGEGLYAIERDGQKLRGTSGVIWPLIQDVPSRRSGGEKFRILSEAWRIVELLTQVHDVPYRDRPAADHFDESNYAKDSRTRTRAGVFTGNSVTSVS